MKTMRNVLNTWGFGLLAALMLLCLTIGASAEGTTVPLSDYAGSFDPHLYANRNGEPLPKYVDNEQSLFFSLQISDFASSDLVAFLKENPEADFTVPLDFTDKLLGNYPTKINPDDCDNVGYADAAEEIPLFRWWIDENGQQIRVRFDRNWIDNVGNNTVVEKVQLGFDGTLNVAEKGDTGKIEFGAAGETFSLQMKTGYTLRKTAGIPYYSTDAKSYVTNYTVTLTLDQNMMLSGNADLYTAGLTLVDTVKNGGALQGVLAGPVTVSAPTGEEVSAIVTSGNAVNTLTLSSPDQKLNKGTYTFTYKMKIDPAAAAARLEGYTEEEKTNTVELKENAESLNPELTAAASISWKNVTENQFKIDKNAFTDQGADYGGIYLDKENERYYIDFRVVVYIREEADSFVVTDVPSGFSFRTDKGVTLEGMDASSTYWSNNINTTPLSVLSGENKPTVTSSINRKGHNVITVTAAENKKLQPGAYYLRIPADVTASVLQSDGSVNPRKFTNTANLTRVDDIPTTEKKEYSQTIPNHTNPDKGGGFEVDPNTGKLLEYEGKPVIRWDVWMGWDFYDQSVFEDNMEGMELLVNRTYPFEIHSFENSSSRKERLVHLEDTTDTTYLDFKEDGTGFTFRTEALDLNEDGTPVKLYKLVYFTTPLDNAEGGYVNTGYNNKYEITHMDPFGNGFGSGPVTGEATPTMTENARLQVDKFHVADLNDTTTKWQITVKNPKNVPLSVLDNLTVFDLIPAPSGKKGEIEWLKVIYSENRPITLTMTLDNGSVVPLTEGVHYTISKEIDGFDMGTNGERGFGAVMNMDALASLFEAQNATYFKQIDMTLYLENAPGKPGGANEKTLVNSGSVQFTNQNVLLYASDVATYKRGFATRTKGAVKYGDNYDPNANRRYYVCTTEGTPGTMTTFTGGYDDDPTTGDGQDEIVWRIMLGAREFEKNPDPITVTVTDTISDNQMFPDYGRPLKDQFLIRAKSNQDYIIIPDSVVLNGNTFTLTFTVPGGKWVPGGEWSSCDLYIYYHTILKPGVLQDALDAAGEDATSFTVEYSNTASAGWNGESISIPTARDSAVFDHVALDKTSKFMESAGNKVSYTIDMNPYQLDLADGDVILLEDHMGAGRDVFVYVASSFKVINPETGVQLSPASAASPTTYVLEMADDGKSFTLDVPDNTHLKLTYQVKTTQPVGTADVSLLNNATLAGRKPQQESIIFDVLSSYQYGAFTVLPDEAGIRLAKISSEGADSDTPVSLPGAEFTLTWFDASLQQNGEPQTLTTSANGLIEIKQKLTDVMYLVIEETKAPDGYRLDSTPWKWCYVLVPTSDALSGVDMASLKETVKCEVTVIPAGSHAEDTITNDPASLIVRKVDETSNLLDGAVLILKDQSGSTVAPDRTHAVSGEWKYAQLAAGSYTLIEEAPPEGYQKSAESPWAFEMDENGSIRLAQAYEDLSLSDDGLYLTITNQPIPPYVSVEAAKVWVNADGTGAAPDRAAVVFTLYADGAATDYTVTLDGVADEVPAAAGGYEMEAWKAAFVNLPKCQEGTDTEIVYTVAETSGVKGYTASPAEPVADGGTITNTQDTARLTVCKNVAKKIPEHLNISFKFTVTLDDQTINGQYGDMKFTNGVAELFLRHDESITADGLPGGIHYTVTEEPVPGFTVEATGHEGETVQDEDVTAVFTNIFTPEPVTASFPVQKVLTVPEGLEGPEAWSFDITVSAEDGAPEAESMTGTVSEANDTVTFGPFSYDTPGTYTYTVTESGEVDGVANDPVAARTVTVTVVDIQDGTLTATADYTDEVPVTFTNSYKAESVEVSFPVQKVLTVPEGQEGPEAWSYDITVAAEDGAPEAESMTGTVSETNDIVTFGPFTYTLPGVYTYTVTESGEVDGVTNDPVAARTVTVTVVDNQDGTLTATADYTDEAPVTFTNTYSAGSATASFSVQKVLTVPEGLEGPEAWRYDITVAAEDGAPEAEIMTGTVSETNDTVTFGPFAYALPGVYTYTVTESGEVDGVTNDPVAARTVTVTVVDNQDGTLTATADYTDEVPVIFTNSYKAEPVEVSFSVQKVLTVPEGLEGPEAWRYDITVSAEDGAPEAECMTGTVSEANDTVTFGPFTYTLPGVYTYTVTESGEVDGVTNDPVAARTVTVTVVDNQDGTLTATADYTDEAPVTFTNSYKAESAEVSFPVQKVLTVPEGLEGPEAWSFDITVAAEDGAPEAEAMTGTVSETNDTVTFGPFAYSLPGVYTYTVTESGEVDGVTNDPVAARTVTVTGVDNQDGTLTATADYTDEVPVIFTNSYKAESAEVSFPVQKVLTVPEGLEGPEAWSFDITVAAEDGAPEAETMTGVVSNDADTVTFGPFTYALPGVYTYTVTESGEVDGVANDPVAARTVTVTVVDNQDGTLTVTADYTDEVPVIFTNSYKAESAEVSFPVQKVLTVPEGLEGPEAWSFDITVAAEDGAPEAETMTGVVSNDADTVTFGPFVYALPGVYTYTVTESGEIDGVTNDSAAETGKTVTVTVVENQDGTLTATADYTDEAPVTFTNSYKAESAEVSFSVQKVLTVPEGLEGPEAWSYDITVSAEDGAPEAESMTGTASETNDTVTFGPFTYTLPGIYTYTVIESGEVEGVANDPVVARTVTVTVVDNQDGTLTAIADYTDEVPAIFTNSYKAEPVEVSFPVQKVLTVPEGLEGPEAWSFDITVAAEDGAPEAETMTGVVSNDADTVTFGPFVYALPGVYTYTVTESGKVDGVTNDSAAETGKTVTVTVVDNQDGTLTATADYTDEAPVIFTNSYKAESAEVSFSVQKVLTVPEGLEGPEAWSFDITVSAEDGAPEAESMTGVVSHDEDIITFGPFTYTLPGVYTYTVTESGEVDGVANDPVAARTVTVTVVDNQDGTLTATADYTDEAPVIFTNTYNVGSATVSFPVQKVLTVPEGLEGPEAWSFDITVAAEDGAPEAEIMTGVVSNDADTVTFGPFTYTLPGVYTYTVTESGEVDGVANDPVAARTVTVTVVDNQDGTLTATADYTDEAPVIFTNSYKAESAEVSFPVQKVLTVPEGQEGPEAWSYDITVAAEDGAPEAEIMAGTVSETNDIITFGPFTYTLPGVYTYTVTESGEVDGVANDPVAARTVTVTVVDIQDGTLTATADYTDEVPVTFTNSYKAESVEVSFPVQKVLTVPEGQEGPEAWSYDITVAAEDGAPEAESMTGTVSETNDIVTFGPFTYTLPGVYTYTVTESGEVDGVTNDPVAARTVTVTVVDNQDGTLTATADYTDEAPVTFTNTYSAGSATASFSVQKVLTVPEGLEGPEAWRYDITVAAEDGAPEAEIMTGTVSETNDTVTFGPFAYALPGVYTYTVTESGEVDGVTNDPVAARTVTVTVVDNQDGTLTATADYTDEALVIFTNSYKAEPVELALQVEKALIGRDLAEGEFSFTLQDQASGEILTARNGADGTVVFPAIEYTAVGKYVYTISETQGTLNGVTYDPHAVTAVVTVTDNGEGALAATAEYSGETTFRNTYMSSGDLLLSAVKTVNGAEPRADEQFTFELCDAAGNVLQTKQNVQGSITFDVLHYTLDDANKNFLYQIREKQEDKPGYTTDLTVYSVAVGVADRGDGTLTVTHAITSGNKIMEAIVFNNTYTAEGEWTPTASKTVNGAEPREDQVYEFTLTDAEGNTILAENAKGDITFETLTYDLSDAGKTYTYTVKETTESTTLLAADERIYTVDVTVTDNKDGTLDVQPVITRDGAEVEEITFENKLTTLLSISKTVTGVETAEPFPFTVKLYHADGTEAVGEYACTGAVEGKLYSGDTIELTHGQTVTISGLLPGMTYSVTEAVSAAFETTVNGSAGSSIEGTLTENLNAVSFVNKFRTTIFMVRKSWQGGGGGAIELTLYANGEKIEPQPAYTRDGDVYTYSDLPMYDEQEQIIVYSAKEKYFDGFLTIYDNVAPYQDETKAIYHGGTIINKAIVKADFSVKKTWSGLAEDETAPEITLVLYCNGEPTDIQMPEPDRNGWYKYYDLPGEVDGVKAVYTVKELPVENFMTSYQLADGTSSEYADNGGTITNTKIPQTGDPAPLAVWLTLMGASAAMLMLLLKRRRV